MTRRRRLAISTSFGAGILVASLAPTPLTYYVLLPGLFLASPFWPEGIHSGAGLSGAGVYAYLATIYLVVIGGWGALMYTLLGRTTKRSEEGR